MRGMARRGGAGQAHRNEGETAAPGDVDAPGAIELGVGADTVAEALGAVASDGGDLPGGEVDAADVTVAIVLRCIGGGQTLTARRSHQRSASNWRGV